jgi:hypothetical protein
LVFSKKMAQQSENESVTRADLQAFEDRLVQSLMQSRAEILEKIRALIRDYQTELLRAFERAATFEAEADFVTLRSASLENPPWDKI